MLQVPLVIAHTGCEGSPVNTVPSMLRGVRSGADAVEIDVRSTKDGALILMHDEYIPTRPGGRIPLGTLTLIELLELEGKGKIRSDHPGLRITRLAQALEAACEFGSVVNLDLKDDRSITELCRAVKRYDLVERVVVTGCDPARAVKVKKECPELQVLLNIAGSGEGPFVGDDETVKKMCSQAVSASCCGINIDFRLCSTRLVEYARMRYLPVSVWTVDRRDDMMSMIAMGVHSITTYEPARLKQMVVERYSAART
jgi:glycerophosphoryl diester phosphodiesterase